MKRYLLLLVGLTMLLSPVLVSGCSAPAPELGSAENPVKLSS